MYLRPFVCWSLQIRSAPFLFLYLREFSSASFSIAINHTSQAHPFFYSPRNKNFNCFASIRSDKRRTYSTTTMTDLISTPFDRNSTALQVIAGVDLSGKQAIVTGASSGIGIETARALTCPSQSKCNARSTRHGGRTDCRS